jgi:hypothetical protein
MSILIQIKYAGSVIWQDTQDVVWMDTDGGVVWQDQEADAGHYLSLDGVALSHYWDGFVSGFSSPNYQTAKRWGGFVQVDFGTITLSPKVFENDYKPPKFLDIIIKYAATDEASAVTLFNGTVYLQRYTKDDVTYQINAPTYPTDLLDTTTDYDGNTSPVPRAFGIVNHVEPLRLPDTGVNAYPTYHMAGLLSSSIAYAISYIASASGGTKTKIVCVNNHSFSNGNSVTIGGIAELDGTYTVESCSGKVFVIPEAFPGDIHTPIVANALLSGSFAVYTDGVPVSEDDYTISGSSFYMTVAPVGVVTMSGTSAYTSLEEIMGWAVARLRIPSSDFSAGRATSPEVSCYITDQIKTIDFLSELCAFFTHYFYIQDSVLYLGDMLLDNGTDTLDENDYHDVEYGVAPPVNALKSEWETPDEYEGYLDDQVTTRYYIRMIQNKLVETQYERATGTTDVTSFKQLIDAGVDFAGAGVSVGDFARNTDDDTEAIVLAVATGALDLGEDIFVSGENYSVGPSYDFGITEDIVPYHTDKAIIKTALQNILSVLTKDTVDMTLPIFGALPNPGQKITFTDDRMIQDTSAWFRVREVSPDYPNYKVMISGEGEVN